jgi:hypothetical protein
VKERDVTAVVRRREVIKMIINDFSVFSILNALE